jgi:hypothetical protein
VAGFFIPGEIMAISDTREAKKYAANAEVSAAEAKSYAEDAMQAEKYSDQAKESATAAQESAVNAEESASSALDSSNTATEAASNALTSANNAETSARNASISANVYQSLSAAQAAITEGLIPLDGVFSFDSGDDESYVEQGRNVSGVATPTGKKSPSTKYIQNSESDSLQVIQEGSRVVASVFSDSKWTQSTIAGWSLGFVAESQFINYVDLLVFNIRNADHYAITVYQRGIDTTATLPGAETDEILYSGIINSNDVAQKSQYVGGFQLCRFSFPTLSVSTTLSTMISLVAYDSNDQKIYMGLGKKINNDTSSLTGSQIGYYLNIADNVWRLATSDQLSLTAGYEIDTPKSYINSEVDQLGISPSITRSSNSSGFYGDTAGGNSDFWGWSVGITGVSGKISSISLKHTNLLLNDKIRYLVTLRSNDDLASTQPLRSLPKDVNIYSSYLIPSEIASTNDAVDVIYKFPETTIPSGYFICIEVIAVSSSESPGHLGVGSHVYTSNGPSNAIERGLFLRANTAGSWNVITNPLAAVAFSCGSIDFLSVKGSFVKIDEKISNLQAKTNDLPQAINVSMPTIFNRLSNSNQFSAYTLPDTSTFYAWAVPSPSASGYISSVSLTLDAVARNSEIRIRILSRLRSNIGATNAPNTLAGDAVISDQRVSPASISLSNMMGVVSIPITPFNLPDSSYLIVEITGLVSSSEGFLGSGSHVISNEQDPGISQRGWYVRRDNPGVWKNILVSSALPIQVSFTASQTLKSFSQNVSEKADAVYPFLLDRYTPSLSGLGPFGLSIDLTNSKAVVDGVNLTFGSLLTLAPTSSGTETKNGVTLNFASSTAQWPSNSGNAWLGRKRLSGVSVVKASDSSTLNYGTDYNVDFYGGKLRGLINTTGYLVNATYTYTKERYDLIQVNPNTLAISVLQGTERDFDACEYKPLPSAGMVPLYYVLVAGNSTELEPVYKTFWNSGHGLGYSNDQFDIDRHNKRCLRKTIGRLAQGQNITLIGYGDSITAVSNIFNPNTTPNGTTRDIRAFLLPGYGTDTMDSKYPGVDLGYGDGAVHLKIGWNWRLKEFFEDNYGITCNYLNFGVSGSNSSSGVSSSRLNSVLAAGGNLMVLCFGMNDNSSSVLYANMLSIIQQAKSSGMEVIVMPIPRTPNTEDGRYIVSDWRFMNRQIYHAAIDGGAAFVPAHWLTEDYSRGGMGLVTTSLCAADLRNHPGGEEFKKYGDALVDIFC